MTADNGVEDLGVLLHHMRTRPWTDASAQDLRGMYNSCYVSLNNANRRGDIPAALRNAREVLGLIPDSETFVKNRVLSEIEIAEKKTVLKSKVRGLGVELTSRCNLRCIMCAHPLNGRDNPSLSQKQFDDLASHFPYIEWINWIGGEPLLYPHMKELMQEAARYPHIYQGITTNGTLLTQPWAEFLVKNRVEVRISIDGVTKDADEKIRRGTDFDGLMRNVKNFKELQKSDPQALRPHLLVTVMRSNYRQLEEFIDFAGEHGFGHVRLNAVIGDRAGGENIFDEHDAAAIAHINGAMPSVYEKAERYGIRLENRMPIAESLIPKNEHFSDDRQLCFLPWIYLHINIEGNVMPYCYCSKALGNAGTATIDELWNCDTMQEYRAKISGNRAGEICVANCLNGVNDRRTLRWA